MPQVAVTGGRFASLRYSAAPKSGNYFVLKSVSQICLVFCSFNERGRRREYSLIPIWDRDSVYGVGINAIGPLRGFWQKRPDAKESLIAGYAIASRSNWSSPADVKQAYRNASFIAGNRVVFNIKGNDYRLVVAMHYNRQIAYIRFVGTHRQYDQIDATLV